MKLLNNISLLGIIATVILMSSCDKTTPYDVAVAGSEAHFVGNKTQVYSVLTDPPPAYYIVVGSTDVSSSPRTVTYNVTSPSGAIEGVDYTLGTSGTLTIPAGGSLDTIDVHAVFSQFPQDAIDTLIFSLSAPSMKVADFQDTVILIIKGPSTCSESVPNLNTLVGDYTNTNEVFAGGPYGPYTTTISAVSYTSATSGIITVENIWNNGWGSIDFMLDWTDPINRTAVVIPVDAISGSDAGDINSAYAGQTIAVKVPSTTLAPDPGFYSYCDETFTLQMQLGVTALGYFNALYTVTMER